MPELIDMPKSARLYATAVCAVGLAAFVYAALQWPAGGYARLFFFICAAIGMSAMKVVLPKIDGTLSLGFLCVLISLVELPVAHTIVIGAASILVQSLWRRRNKATWIQTAFNMSAIAISIGLASGFYRWAASGRSGLVQAVALLLMAGIYFFSNTLLVTRIMSLMNGTSAIHLWKECYFWTFPYYIVGACVAGMMGALTDHFGWSSCVIAMPVIVLMFRTYSDYLGRLENEHNHTRDIAALHLRTIETLALAIAAKDQNTHEHLRRVQIYSMEIGRELGLKGDDLSAIHAAALLHDIGKLAIPEQILSKPGKLLREEFEKVKTHPLVGAEILEQVAFPYPVVPIVRGHHEKWDGTGYPDGLRGTEIPIGARILSAVDCLDALASDRPYRRAIPMDEAMEWIVKDSGTSFDPQVVAILKRRYRELEEISRQPRVIKRLSTGVRIERGLAPAAGFEQVRMPGVADATGPDHLCSIAAASKEFRLLSEVAREAGRSLSLDETFAVVARRIAGLVPHDAFVLYVCRGRVAVAEYAVGSRSELLSSLRVPFGEGLCGWVALNGVPVLNGNPALEPGFGKEGSGPGGLQSAMAVPLTGADGIVGVLAVYRTDQNAFNNDHLRILTAVTAGVGPAIANALTYQKLEDTALTDDLTGLANSRGLYAYMEKEVARARRISGRFAVLVCDLDGFKNVNDRHGHLAGNRVLQAFARGLAGASGEYDFTARLSGDEFVVVFSGQEAELSAMEAHMEEVARRAGVEICGEASVSVSIGHAFFPDHGQDVEMLLGKADEQMYLRKQERRAGVRAFPRVAQAAAVADRAMAGAGRHGD